MTTPVGFECTIRALRIQKPMTRLAWSQFDHPTWIDYDDLLHEIFICTKYPDQSVARVPYKASSDDLLATDWVTYG